MRTFRSYLGEMLFLLSYAFFGVYFFQLFRARIFDGDAFHLFIILQWLGYLAGGTRLGGLAWARLLTQPRALSRVMPGLYVGWSLLWGAIAILRFYGFTARDFDLGIFSQVVWNLSRGDGFATQMTLGGAPTILGDHQEYTKVVFTPLFWTGIGCELLLILQPFLFFLPGLLLARFVRKDWAARLGSKNAALWAWIVALAWFLNAPLVGNTLWDFHETALTVPLLALWAWSLVEGRVGTFILAGILAGLTKEHLFVVLLPGIFLFAAVHGSRTWRADNRRLDPRLLALGAAVIAHLVIFVVGQKLFATPGLQTERYGKFGGSISEIITNVVLHPRLILEIVGDRSRLLFLRDAIGPLMYAPLYAGWFSLAWIPIFLTHAVSATASQISKHFHYILEIWGVASVIGIYGWKAVFEQIRKRCPGPAAGVYMALAATFVLWYGPTSPVVRAREFAPKALACAHVRWELRQAVRDLNSACTDPRGAVGTGTDGLTTLLIDLTPVYPFRGMAWTAST